MRIAMIAPPWVSVPPLAYGGTEAVVDQLCRGLDRAGHEVVLFATGDSTCPVPTRWIYERAQDAKIGDVAIELRHALHAYEMLDGFDVVHDHTLVGPVHASERAGVATVTTNHGPFEGELAAIYRHIAGRVGIIAISARQAAAARDIAITRVIHHGVDPALFPVGAGRSDHVVFLGRMCPSKGAHLAAAAAREAGVPLLMAAKMREEAERRYFDDFVRPQLGKGVEYIGEVGFEEKIDLLRDARALLNPIQWEEPFGMAMIEALACATPVIACARGSAHEIVDHGRTGYLCRSAADLVAGLASIDRLDRAACRQIVEQRFCTARMVADHVEVYERIVELSARRVGAAA